MPTKHERWDQWLDRTLLHEIQSASSPDPVPMFTAGPDGIERTTAFDEYRYGRGEGEYLYLLYLLDEPGSDPHDVTPLYIGETNSVTSRLLQHFKRIRDSPAIEEWTDDGSWGSWSTYDHLAAVCAQAETAPSVWILDVSTIETGPYDVPTYRQELEAKLVGLVHSLPGVSRQFANREFVPNRVAYEQGTAGPDWVTGEAAQPERPTLDPQPSVQLTDTTKPELWHDWVREVLLTDLRADDTADPIPLFETDDTLQVHLRPSGGLKRSEAITQRIRREGNRCVHDTGVTDGPPDGLLYVLYQLADPIDHLDATSIVPRYIGKAEAYGKHNELSANFEEIAKDRDATRSFARWGDGDYWHTGELSNAVLGKGTKKVAWASELFEQGTRRLTQQTYLWVRAWDPETYRGPYGYDATLAEAEPLLIGLAYAAAPDSLLNQSGVPSTAPVKTRTYHFEPADE